MVSGRGYCERLRDVVFEVGTTKLVKALVRDVVVKQAKNFSNYILFDAADGDRVIKCKVWNADERILGLVKSGSVYQFYLEVGEYNSNLTYVASRFLLMEDKVSDYVVAVKGVNRYYDDILEAIDGLGTESSVGRIVRELLTEDVLKVAMGKPAAKKFHHNLAGGWMMHTACVLRNCLTLYNLYVGTKEFELNRNVLISAALLHDYGKLEEMELDAGSGSVNYTESGSLLGHISIGAMAVDRAAVKLNLLGDGDVIKLKHCILSHHGELAMGSPVSPRMGEAWILSFADNLDAKMWDYRIAGELVRKM
jgi:3'-5' exoribonuclease